ncbi:MAG TPA: glycosyltransferase family 1 protein [Stellaceae bacterium]|nr:glycosyltransferase family 1 protein [Stellaceae bacterium]
MSRRIYYDGLNLSLEHGTGIATYARTLANVVRALGYEVGVVYSSPHRPPANRLLREIAFFDPNNAVRISRLRGYSNRWIDQLRYARGVATNTLTLSGAIVTEHFERRLPLQARMFVARNLFANARIYYSWSGRFAELTFETPPDILHCTYQLPLRAKGACNIYTIHDLVPLRLPYTTLDNKRQTYRLLRKIAAEADHIVTVSEQSKRDIVEILGIDAGRVTNTYEAVHFRPEYIERPDELVAAQLESALQLEMHGYLLFYGAFEPKKNIGRLIDAYLLSATDMPLVITGPPGWGTQGETALLRQAHDEDRSGTRLRRRFYRLEYASRSMLVTLIRGARAVLFPSLYEGFGLPVLEAMALGTPVVTSRTSSLPEVAGDAALYVDPYDTDDIARAIQKITADDGLCAELSRRGRLQAEQFSVERYSARVAALYKGLGVSASG